MRSCQLQEAQLWPKAAMNTQTFSRQLQTQGIASQEASYQFSEFSVQEPSQYAQYGEYPDFKDFSQVKEKLGPYLHNEARLGCTEAVPLAPGHTPGRRLDRRLQPGHCCGALSCKVVLCSLSASMKAEVFPQAAANAALDGGDASSISGVTDRISEVSLR